MRIGHRTPEKQAQGKRGQSLVEFMLITPVLLFLIMGIIDFGRAMFTYSQASNALRDSLRYGAITGIDPSNPQFADCTTILDTASNGERIWFARSVTPELTYTHAGGGQETVPTLDPCPPSNAHLLGDRLTVRTTTEIDLLTPAINSLFPTLTFNLEGTRTLTAGGVTYGEGVSALPQPSPIASSCPGNAFLQLEWTTVEEADSYRVYRGTGGGAPSTLLTEIADSDADDYVNVGTSGCGAVPPSVPPAPGPISCHGAGSLWDPLDFTPYNYRVYPVNASGQGLGADFASVVCPAPAVPDDVDSVTIVQESCGFGDPTGDAFFRLTWTHPDEATVDEYLLYKDAVAGTPVNTFTPPALSCADCDPGWDGELGTYFLVASNLGGESAGVQVDISACAPVTTFYLKGTNVGDDGNPVPDATANPDIDVSNALNAVCDDPTATTVNMDRLTDYGWLTQAYDADVTYGSGSTYTLYVDKALSSQAQTLSFNVGLYVCNGLGQLCNLAGSGTTSPTDFTEPAADDQAIPITVGADFTVSAGDRLRVRLGYDSESGGNPNFDMGVSGCSGSNNSRLEITP